MLTMAPVSSTYVMFRDDAEPPIQICQVGSTRLTYRACAIDDLHAWLRDQRDCRSGQPTRRRLKQTAQWRRSVGSRKTRGAAGTDCSGYGGRFGRYLPPLLKVVGLAELTHDPRNSMRAI